MGTALIGSILVLMSNLLADILYAVVDPRIRYS
jgi:peptide/nickel transport system permease protein